MVRRSSNLDRVTINLADHIQERYKPFLFFIILFGLTNDPSFFIDHINEVGENKIQNCFKISSYSKILDDHPHQIDFFLKNLRKVNSSGKLTKSEFAVSKVRCLEQMILRDGI